MQRIPQYTGLWLGASGGAARLTLKRNNKDLEACAKKLFKEGEKKIAQKFGEESAELIIDFLKGSKRRTTEEAIDVIYHLFVLLSAKKIKFNELEKEISKRKNVR